MTNKATWSAAAAGALLLGGAALVARDQPAQAAPQKTQAVPEVPVAEVIVRRLAPTVEATAAIAALESVDVRARVSGFVESVAFEEGGLVREGQVLFQLDARPFRANLARARAELTRALELERHAKLKLARGDKLAPSGVISDSAYDLLRADAAQSSASVAALRAAVQSAELELSYTRIVSPISGRVGQALVKAGNLVSGGTDHASVLTTVVSTDPVHVTFDVDESTYRKLSAQRQRSEGRLPRGAVSLALAGENGYPHLAELDYLGNVLDGSTGTARARAVLENDDGLFAPGLFARVRIATGEPRDALLVSDKAVHTDQEGRYLLVVTSEGLIEQRHVQTGSTVDGLRLIEAGITQGERVVLTSMVRPGMQVKPRAVTMLESTSTLSARSTP